MIILLLTTCAQDDSPGLVRGQSMLLERVKD